MNPSHSSTTTSTPGTSPAAAQPPGPGTGARTRDPVLAASAAVGFAVLVAVLLIPHEALPTDATAAQVTEFFSAHYALQQSQTVMHSLGTVALLVFFARLAAVVGRLQRPGESAAGLVLASAAALTGLVVTVMGFVSAAIYLTGDIDGGLQESLYLMGWDFHFKVAYLIPLVLVPACWVLRREHAAPAAVTWSGLGIGGLALVSTLGNLSTGTMFVQYPVFMLFLLWTLVAGLVLGLRGVRLPLTGAVAADLPRESWSATTAAG